MEELKRAKGTPEDARMEVLLHDQDLFIAGVYSTKRFDIEYEGDLSIESNLASPLEAKSWVLLDTSLEFQPVLLLSVGVNSSRFSY